MFQPGQSVIWTYTTTRGWGWTFRIPATVVKVTAKRVVIDAKTKDGSTKRRTVNPQSLEASDGR